MMVVKYVATMSALGFSLLIPAMGAVTLGFHDAQVIAEHTPAFIEAVKAGECPEISDGTLNGSVATFIIRSGCGHDVSGYIVGIYIDTKTGIVTKDNGTRSGLEIESPELAELRKKLFSDRASARITRREAMCLLRVASSLASGGKACGVPTIVSEEDNRFIASAGGCGGTPQQLVVDRFIGTVTDLKTGVAYSSPGFKQISTDVTESHSDARLTPEDARRLAAAYADTLGSASGKCADIRLDPQHTADEVWFVVARGCSADPALTVLAVNVATGGLRVVGPNTSPDSPQIRALREKLLAEAQGRRSATATKVQMECKE